MLETRTYKLTGETPLLMHNVRLSDPRDPHTREMKRLSALRKKTDEILDQMARVEWEGGLYLDPKTGAPAMPADCILGMVIEGAKKIKAGPLAKSGVFEAASFYPLIYDGPKDIEGLWESGDHADVRPVVVQRNKVMRCRPIFSEWAVEVELRYELEVMPTETLDEILRLAGLRAGLGDFRPRFGRFTVETMY